MNETNVATKISFRTVQFAPFCCIYAYLFFPPEIIGKKIQKLQLKCDAYLLYIHSLEKNK